MFDVFGIMLNAEPFVEAWVEQARYAAGPNGKVVVVEGLANREPHAYNPRFKIAGMTPFHREGRSIDRTSEILKKLGVDVLVCDGLWPNKNEMWNRGLDAVIDGPNEHVLVLDHDEFFRKDDLQQLKQVMSQHRCAAGFMTHSQFCGDYYHWCRPINDTVKTTWGYEPHLHGRMFTKHPGLRFLQHDPVVVAPNDCVRVPLEIPCDHYSYVFPRQVAFKTAYYVDPRMDQTKCFKEWQQGKDFSQGGWFVPTTRLVRIPDGYHHKILDYVPTLPPLPTT